MHRPSFAFANRYRKHFHLPTEWQDDGGATFVHFEGVFHHSTLFLNGSHKSAFLAPESLQDPASPMWTTYSCPPGSLVIFAESTTHSTAPWTSAERDRVAVFSRYNHVNSRWHNWNPHPDYLAGLSPKRRTLFRPIHVQGNLVEV